MSNGHEDNRNNQFPRWERLSELDAGYDLDLVRDPGLYVVYQPVNGPVAGSDIFLQAMSANVGGVHRTMQRAYLTVTGRSYTRVRGDAGWLAWNWDNPLTQTDKLTADRIYYVRVNGNDNNDGRTNTDAGALKTAQAAADKISSLDLGSYGVTVIFQTGGDYGDFIITSLKHDTTTSNLAYSGATIALDGDPNNSYNVLCKNYKLGKIWISGNRDTKINIRGFQYGYNINDAIDTPIKITVAAYVQVINGYCDKNIACGQYIDVTEALANNIHVDKASLTYLMAAKGNTYARTSSVVMDQVTTFTSAAYLLQPDGIKQPVIQDSASNTPNGSTGRQYTKTGFSPKYGEFRSAANIGASSTGVISGVFGDTAPQNPRSWKWGRKVVSGVLTGSLSNADYNLALPGGYRICRLWAKLRSGTATLQVKSGTTNLGGAVSLTSTASDTEYVSIVGYNDDTIFTLSAGASPVDLSWFMEIEPIYYNNIY